MPNRQTQVILTLLVSISAVITAVANAQTDHSSSSSSTPTDADATPQDTQNYWTEERLRNAKPLELHPVPRPDSSPQAGPNNSATSKRGEGHPPQER